MCFRHSCICKWITKDSQFYGCCNNVPEVQLFGVLVSQLHLVHITIFFVAAPNYHNSLSFRSVIEQYDLSISDSTPDSRQHTSPSRNSLSRSSSPHLTSSTFAADSRSSLRIAHERVRLALKCNPVSVSFSISHIAFNLIQYKFLQICHFDAHISSFSSSRISNVSAKRDFDRMVSLHLLLDKMDLCAARANCAKSRMFCTDGAHVSRLCDLLFHTPHFFWYVTYYTSTPGNVFGAEISHFGRTPPHVRLPSQTTAVAADFVECWAIPRSSLKGIADSFILCAIYPWSRRLSSANAALQNIWSFAEPSAHNVARKDGRIMRLAGFQKKN